MTTDNPHTITTDADARPTFTCSAPAAANCHAWPDCLEGEDCTGPEDCEHPTTQHDSCLYAEWFSDPVEAAAMYLHEDDDTRAIPPNYTAPVLIEWDECPLWEFDRAVLPSHPVFRA